MFVLFSQKRVSLISRIVEPAVGTWTSDVISPVILSGGCRGSLFASPEQRKDA